jgi:O-antigen/teichoic acid export membrane protein
MAPSLIFSALLGIALFIVQNFGPAAWLHEKVWYILTFFFGISLFINRLMEQGFRNKREKFVQFYLSTIVGRLILCCVFIGIMLYIGLENPFLFVVNFFALYLFYTFFEIYILYRKLRRDS